LDVLWLQSHIREFISLMLPSSIWQIIFYWNMWVLQPIILKGMGRLNLLTRSLNYSSIVVLFNNSISCSCLHLCSLLCVSFSFTIFCSFSITFFALMLLWTLELRKRTQLPTINTNYFIVTPFFFVLELFAHHIHFLTYPPSFN